MKRKILVSIQILVLATVVVFQTACDAKSVAEYTADAYSGLNQFIQYCGTLNKAGKLSDDKYRQALKMHDKILTSLDSFKDRARKTGTIDTNNKQDLITFISDSVTDTGNLMVALGITDPVLTTAIGLAQVGLTGVQTWLAGIKGPVAVTSKIVAQFDFYYDERVRRDMEIFDKEIRRIQQKTDADMKKIQERIGE